LILKQLDIGDYKTPNTAIHPIDTRPLDKRSYCL